MKTILLSIILVGISITQAFAQSKTPERLLILHVDDLGVDPAINQAIVALADSGLTVSGSIIAPSAYVDDLLARVRTHPDIDLGVHLALTAEWPQRKWGPITRLSHSSPLLASEGMFVHPYPDSALVDSVEVEKELLAQIALLRTKGFRLSHLDTHEGILQRPEYRALYPRLGVESRLPVLQSVEQYYGKIEGRRPRVKSSPYMLECVATILPDVDSARWFAFYEKAIHDLPQGISELIVHAAVDAPTLYTSMPKDDPWGAAWRVREFTTLASPRFRALLKANGIHLITWRDVPCSGEGPVKK